MKDWKPFGYWISTPTGGNKKPYESGAYWNGLSKYAIVTCPWSRHNKSTPRYDIYEIPKSFIGDKGMVNHLKNPLLIDIRTLDEAISIVELLETKDGYHKDDYIHVNWNSISNEEREDFKENMIDSNKMVENQLYFITYYTGIDNENGYLISDCGIGRLCRNTDTDFFFDTEDGKKVSTEFVEAYAECKKIQPYEMTQKEYEKFYKFVKN